MFLFLWLALKAEPTQVPNIFQDEKDVYSSYLFVFSPHLYAPWTKHDQTLPSPAESIQECLILRHTETFLAPVHPVHPVPMTDGSVSFVYEFTRKQVLEAYNKDLVLPGVDLVLTETHGALKTTTWF